MWSLLGERPQLSNPPIEEDQFIMLALMNKIRQTGLLPIAVSALLLSGCGGTGAGSASTTPSVEQQQANALNAKATATVTLNLSTSNPTPGSQVAATVQIQNTGSAAVSAANFTLALPPGFAASNVAQGTPSCGGYINSTASDVTLTNGKIFAKDTCSISFTLTTPTLALASTYTPAFTFSNLSNLTAGKAPSLALTANTPPPPPASGTIGSTPGELTWWNMPSTTTALSEMDFYITPSADPGPNSDVYWSNEFDGLSGYTGMQTTVLTSPQTGQAGKLFLFSIWGATSYQTGTAPGSWCQFGTDGASGWSCRYVYDWQVNHTYRFRLSALGNAWYKVNVTDMNGTDSFDIGSLQIDATQLPNAVNSIPANGGLSQWVENFDWNDPRTTCLDVPYSNVTETMTAIDAATGLTVQPSLSQTSNPSQPNVCSNQAGGISGSSATLTSGTGQTARGLFKNAAGNCINAEGGLGENANAILYACPTAADTATYGSPSDNTLWVFAQDGSIRATSNYCLTVSDDIGASGAAISVESCIAGAINQEWTISNEKIISKLSGTCLDPAGTTQTSIGNQALTLTSCSSAGTWKTPGKSFSY
jgi:hypothetical protein